ncbi:Polycystin-2 [Nymphon striatum]|nr:Polycystin-2 [Nymphon striatum]
MHARHCPEMETKWTHDKDSNSSMMDNNGPNDDNDYGGAGVLSLICKKTDYDEDDADEDEEDPELKYDETWLHVSDNKRRMRHFGVDQAEVMKNRILREKEVKMTAVLREIFAYVIFLWLLLILSYGNRDPNGRLLQQSILNGFLKPGDIYLDFTKVKTIDKFYRWVTEAFIPELMVTNWYNTRPPNGLGGFVDDRTNFLVGMPIMRQVRIKENSCNVHSIVWNITQNCAGFGKIHNEEDRDYRVGWTLDEDAPESYEYYYQNSSRIQSIPFWGEIDWYGGGGYVYPFIHPLKGQHRHYIREIQKLKRNKWIDKHTRAVFFEFGIYNAQVNLFAYVTIVAEMMPGGGVIPFTRIEILRLMRYHTGFGLFILVCEMVFVCFIIFFTVRETKELIQKKWRYFRDPGNVIEFCIIILAYVGFVLFVQREVVTSEILRLFKLTNGTGYIRLQYVTMIDEALGYIVAILVFLANLKFLHLLRFNKRFGILSETLKGCAAELSGFAICLLIVFLAFVQLFYLILGMHMLDFSTVISSVEASFSMMLGKFKFRQIAKVSPFFGPLVFFIFSLSTTLVLINLLLTIVIRTFFEVKERVMKQPNDFDIMEFIKKRLMITFGITRKHKITPNAPKEDPKRKAINDISKFSEKVNSLLHYVNNTYLGHSVELNGNFRKRMCMQLSGRICRLPSQGHPESLKGYVFLLREEQSEESTMKLWVTKNSKKDWEPEDPSQPVLLYTVCVVLKSLFHAVFEFPAISRIFVCVDAIDINRNCYKYEDINTNDFVISPGSYDPGQLSQTSCVLACSNMAHAYAGMVNGEFCFCADTLVSDENQPRENLGFISGFSTEDLIPDNTRIEVKSAIKTLTIGKSAGEDGDLFYSN